MLFKISALTKTFGISFLLMIILCLGAQNLSEKESLNLGFNTTADLPIGFLVGISIALGFFSGGAAVVFILPSEYNKN